MKRILVSVYLLALMILFSSNANCQMRNGKTYRVTAYKKGDLSVTSVSNETIIIPSLTLYIPNTFTPNNDGINDLFGVNGEAIKEFHMSIFDRWGQKLFESDDINKKWDGTYQGKKLSSGAYLYKITATGIIGLRQSKEGHINLIM